MISPQITLDYTGLRRGIAIAMDASRKELPALLEAVAFYVAVKAQNMTRYVSFQRMDSELMTVKTLRMHRNGKPYSAKNSKNVTLSSGRTVSIKNGRGRSFNVPLAAAIIQSSVILPQVYGGQRPGTYNQRTNHRYARANSPFLGKSRAAGAQAMRAAVSRMIKARHSSSKFLQSGWVAVARQLRANYYGRPPGETTGRLKSKPGFGSVDRAASGDEASITISNLIGMTGRNAANFNQALHAHGGPALQRALDEQGADMERHYGEILRKRLAQAVQPAFV